jgi:hypothetical protein
MAVVLIYRGEFRIDFRFDMFGRHYHDMSALLFLPVGLLEEVLIVLLQPDVLVEPRESLGESEGVLHPQLVLELSVGSVQIVVSQLLH